MSDTRWVITPLWLSGSGRSFWSSSSANSCHIFLISSDSFRSIHFYLYQAHLCMKWSLGICHFLDKISSLFHSVVFLYFFALFAPDGFLISPCYSLEWCVKRLTSFLFSFAFLFSSQLFVRPPQTTIFLSTFLFLVYSLDPCSCTMSQTSVHSSSGTLSDLIH